MRSHLLLAFVVAMEQWTAAHRAFVILKGGDSPWSARSPDLSVCVITFFGGTSNLSVPYAITCHL